MSIDATSIAYVLPELHQFLQPVSTLKMDPKNANVHDAKNLDAIKQSLVQFKQRIPIIGRASDRIITAGNGRLQAARELGWEYIAVLLLNDDDANAAAFALADNRTNELSYWNFDQLQENLAEILGTRQFDSLTALPDILVGFTLPDLEPLLKAEFKPAPVSNEVPQVPTAESASATKSQRTSLLAAVRNLIPGGAKMTDDAVIDTALSAYVQAFDEEELL